MKKMTKNIFKCYNIETHFFLLASSGLEDPESLSMGLFYIIQPILSFNLLLFIFNYINTLYCDFHITGMSCDTISINATNWLNLIFYDKMNDYILLEHQSQCLLCNVSSSSSACEKWLLSLSRRIWPKKRQSSAAAECPPNIRLDLWYLVSVPEIISICGTASVNVCFWSCFQCGCMWL